MRAEQLGLHHFGEAEDGVERRAQFVAHRRQEARLGEIGALRRAAAPRPNCIWPVRVRRSARPSPPGTRSPASALRSSRLASSDEIEQRAAAQRRQQREIDGGVRAPSDHRSSPARSARGRRRPRRESPRRSSRSCRDDQHQQHQREAVRVGIAARAATAARRRPRRAPSKQLRRDEQPAIEAAPRPRGWAG